MSGQVDRRTFLGAVGAGGLAGGAGTVGAVGRAAAAEGVVSSSGEYLLPALPYPYDALEPVLSKELVTIHHDKHHAGYVKGLNGTLDKLAAARKSGDLGSIKALSRDLAFNGSGDVLHTLYWGNMGPKKGGDPQGAVRTQLVKDFGSWEAFKAQFAAATKAVEGSGWGVLVWEPMGKRCLVLQAEKHQDLTIWGCAPLLVCDVWEHAYYLDYKNDRGTYVDKFFDVIDWDEVGKRLSAAMK